MKDIVGAMNWKIIFHCLRKIVFIVENYEENSSQNLREGTLIEQSFDDVTLFRFLYSHKREEYKFSNANLFPYIQIAFHNSTSAFKFVLKSENDDEKVLWNVFRILVTDCPSRIIPVIDLLGEDKEGSLYSFFACLFNFQMWLYLFIRYNEDVVVKIIELFDDLFEMTFGQRDLLILTTDLISKKMIVSLIKRISKFISKNIIDNLILAYESIGYNIDINE